jgi:fibronectin type 3 domain-containing protein
VTIRFRTYSAPAAIFFLVLSFLAPYPSCGQVNVQGQWSTTPNQMPINPVHVALLPNGKILVVAGSGNCPPSQTGCPSGPPYSQANGSGALIWDPATENYTQWFSVSWDMFCNAMVLLPDGRAFINGGTLQYDPFHGALTSAIFDPASNTFTNVQNMAHGRWYPTLVTLGDGRVMTFSGLSETGGTNNAVEFYTVGSGWSTQYFASWTPDLYPRLHLLPNGTVFYSGAQTISKLFNPSTQTWNTNVVTTNYSGTRTYGTSVLLPLTPANNYDPKIIIMGGNSPATNTTEIIDMGASTPTWVYGPNMSQARIEMNAVILPNGKVLAVGGSVNDEDTSSLSLNADLYDPATNTFSSAGANATQRLYHSVALLLPDATVWLAGGNPSRGTYNKSVEIYKPAYLFNSSGGAATQPTISSAPSSISYGNAFTVTTPDASNISSVVLVRNGTVTHAFGMDQRLVGMSFTAGSGLLTVTAPPDGNIAPPGYYMLFLLNSGGVPSVATMVQLGQSSDTQSPTAPSNLAATAVSSSQINLNWTASSDNVGVTGYLVERCTGAACTSFAQIGTSTGITYNDTTVSAGTNYSYRVRATDAAGNLSGYSNVASTTTQATAPTAPTNLTATAGNGQVGLNWTASSGATSYNVKRSTTSGGPYATIVSSTTTSYTNTGLTNGITYFYVVSAVNTAGESANSSQVSATPQGVPPAPTNLTAIAGNKQVVLSWSASSGATSYNVKRSTTSGGPYNIIAAPTTTSYANNRLTNGTTYFYVVSAVNIAGESANSGEVSATPQHK